MLRTYTIPGIWHNQEPEQFIKFSNSLPFIEWGLRYKSPTQMEPHYPTVEWMEMLTGLATKDTRLALHLEGAEAKNFLMGEPTIFQIGERIWSHVRRIQVPLGNLCDGGEEFNIDIPEMADLIHSENFQNHEQGFRCAVFQVKNPQSDTLMYQICQNVRDAYPLFDFQGQNIPTQWPFADFPRTSEGEIRAHGYAADFTKETIIGQIEKIKEASNGGPFWLQGGSAFFGNERNEVLGFGLARNAMEILSPLYKAGCCRQTGSPVRIQYIRLDEGAEWHTE